MESHEQPTPPAGAKALGLLIRERREALGLSLQELGDRVGCAKSYLSAIENQRRSTPSDDVLEKLEGALGMAAGSLVSIGRWQRSLDAGGESVQRDVRSLHESQRAGRRLAELLAEHAPDGGGGANSLDRAYRSGELQRLVDRLASVDEARSGAGAPVPVALPFEVPVINRVAAGYPTEFTDLGYPARCADEYVRCPDIHDADAFAARVVGDSMEPNYREGDIVIFSPAKALASGMDCFVRLEPDHQSTFKRVYFETGEDGSELIRLQPLNNRYGPRTMPREHVAGLYAAVKVIKEIG